MSILKFEIIDLRFLDLTEMLSYISF